MLFIRNLGAVTTPVALSSGANTLSFDTQVYNTNNKVSLASTGTSVSMKTAGIYRVKCTVVVSSTAGGTLTLSLQTGGSAITGDSVSVIIPANGTNTLEIDVPVQVKSSSGSVASLQFVATTTAAMTLSNAFATIEAIPKCR